MFARMKSISRMAAHPRFGLHAVAKPAPRAPSTRTVVWKAAPGESRIHVCPLGILAARRHSTSFSITHKRNATAPSQSRLPVMWGGKVCERDGD